MFPLNLNQISQLSWSLSISLYFSRRQRGTRVSNSRRIGVIALRRIISKSVERTAGHLRRSLVECLAGLLRHSRTVIRGQRSRTRGPAESDAVFPPKERRETRERNDDDEERARKGFLNEVQCTRFPSSSECGDILTVSSDARLIRAHGIDGCMLAK